MEGEIKKVSGVDQKPLRSVFLVQKPALSPPQLQEFSKGNPFAGYCTPFKNRTLGCALVDFLENPVAFFGQFFTQSLNGFLDCGVDGSAQIETQKICVDRPIFLSISVALIACNEHCANLLHAVQSTRTSNPPAALMHRTDRKTSNRRHAA